MCFLSQHELLGPDVRRIWKLSGSPSTVTLKYHSEEVKGRNFHETFGVATQLITLIVIYNFMTKQRKKRGYQAWKAGVYTIHLTAWASIKSMIWHFSNLIWFEMRHRLPVSFSSVRVSWYWSALATGWNILELNVRLHSDRLHFLSLSCSARFILLNKPDQTWTEHNSKITNTMR